MLLSFEVRLAQGPSNLEGHSIKRILQHRHTGPPEAGGGDWECRAAEWTAKARKAQEGMDNSTGSTPQNNVKVPVEPRLMRFS